MVELIAAALGWFVLGWTCRGLQRPMAPPKGSYGARPRGSNPPPPGRKPPAPPAPPYSSAAIAWEEAHTQRGNGRGGPSTPKPEIKPQPSKQERTHRWFINNPAQIAECGGPCTAGPSHCDCGALWVDVVGVDVVGLPPPPEAP